MNKQQIKARILQIIANTNGYIIADENHPNNQI